MASQVEIQEAGPCKKKLKIAVPRDTYREKLDANYRELSTTVRIPGFRPGKAPRQLLEKRFGKHVEEELKQNLIHEATHEAIEEHKLQAIGEPKVENVSFDREKELALEFEVTVAVKPEFDVPSLADLKVERPPIEVKDDEVKGSLEHMKRARGELRAKPDDAAVEPDDFLVADVEWKDPTSGEVALSKSGLPILLKSERIEDTPVPGLTNQLQGLKREQSAEVDATLSEKFPKADLRNQPAKVKVTIKELKQAVYPEMDDAFAKESGFEDLKDMHEQVRNRLLRAKDAEADRVVENRIIEALLGRVKIDLPEDIVQQELTEATARAEMKLRYQGKSADEAEQEAEKQRDETRGEVEQRLKAVFLLDKIAREEKVFVTEDEVDAAVAEMAPRYGKPPAELREELERSGAIARLRADLRSDKTLKLIRSKVQVVDAENR